MKILHLNHYLEYKGGVETYLLSLLPELERQGHEALFVYAEGRPELAHASYAIPSIAETSHGAERQAYQEMTSLLKRERPELIHIHQLYNIGAIRACLETTPTVLTGHDYRYLCPVSSYYYRRSETICPSNAGCHCFPNALRKGCMTPRPYYAYHYYRRVKFIQENIGRIHHVIAPSEYTRSRFVQAGFSPERVTTLPYFCPIEPLDEPRPLPEQATILFVGRIRPNKGYKYFIQALGMLPATVKGVMIGDIAGERLEDIRHWAEMAGCLDRLQLKSWAGREEIRAAFMKATVFVFTSLWAETLGIVGLEALACGVPVVASDVGGVREWLIHEKTGLLVKPKEPSLLADALSHLLNSPNLIGMGREGLKMVRHRFSKQFHLEQLLQRYEIVAQKSKSQARLD